jgi:hypothetical protein
MQFVDEFNDRHAPEELPEAAAPVRVQAPRRLVGAWLVVIPLAAGIGLLAWRLTSGGGGHGQRRAEVAAPTVTHARATTAESRPTTTAPRPRRALIAFVASRGSCWLAVRLGSSTGRVLYQRTLEPGQRAQFAGRQLWIRTGAPWNLDATLNGKPVQLPAAIADLTVTAGGMRTG